MIYSDISDGMNIGTFPSECRPTKYQEWGIIIPANGGNVVGRSIVKNNGEVIVTAATAIKGRTIFMGDYFIT